MKMARYQLAQRIRVDFRRYQKLSNRSKRINFEPLRVDTEHLVAYCAKLQVTLGITLDPLRLSMNWLVNF